VVPSALRPNPRPDELRAALAVLRDHERFGPLAGGEDVIVYQPMPPPSKARSSSAIRSSSAAGDTGSPWSPSSSGRSSSWGASGGASGE
jgi:hypothetical protein